MRIKPIGQGGELRLRAWFFANDMVSDGQGGRTAPVKLDSITSADDLPASKVEVHCRVDYPNTSMDADESRSLPDKNFYLVMRERDVKRIGSRGHVFFKGEIWTKQGDFEIVGSFPSKMSRTAFVQIQKVN